jgi:formylglycine-generating enzyme required for sulfatase activity
LATSLKHFPVEWLLWKDTQDFLKKLNEREKGKGWLYRLLTEAEWEYACRNAATTKKECSFDFYFDKPTNNLSSRQANFNGDFPAGQADKGPVLGRPTKVGSYPPNKLGLYDMHGNVMQWCVTVDDGGGSTPVLRGGSWNFIGLGCSAGQRLWYTPSLRDDSIGFRLARVLSGDKQ